MSCSFRAWGRAGLQAGGEQLLEDLVAGERRVDLPFRSAMPRSSAPLPAGDLARGQREGETKASRRGRRSFPRRTSSGALARQPEPLLAVPVDATHASRTPRGAADQAARARTPPGMKRATERNVSSAPAPPSDDLLVRLRPLAVVLSSTGEEEVVLACEVRVDGALSCSRLPRRCPRGRPRGSRAREDPAGRGDQFVDECRALL